MLTLQCLPIKNDLIVSYSCNVLFPLVFNKCATISQTTLCSMQPAFIPLQIIYAFRCSLNLNVQIDILYIFYLGISTLVQTVLLLQITHTIVGFIRFFDQFRIPNLRNLLWQTEIFFDQ